MNRPQDLMIPDEVLEVLVCSLCQKYLSVQPIKVYPGGIIVCGRCSKTEDEGYYSLCNKIIEKSFFPCVNRYEGCRKALQFNEVSEHEKYCEKTENDCPICSRSMSLTVYELVLHFKLLHRDCFLSKPEFTFNSAKSCYLYCNKLNVFLISVTSVYTVGTLKKLAQIVITTLGSTLNLRKVSVNFEIFDCENSNTRFVPFYGLGVRALHEATSLVKFEINYRRMWTNEINYSPIWSSDNCTGFISYWKKNRSSIYVCKTKMFENHFPNISVNSPTTVYDSQKKKEINLLCGICQQYYSDTICYSRRIGKYLCGCCAQIYSLNFIDDTVSCDIKMSKMYSMLGIRCKFGCEGVFNLLSYVQLRHEDNCSLRPLQKCPIKTCKWKNKISLLDSHFKTTHLRAKLTNNCVITYREINEMYDDIDEIFVKINDKFVRLHFDRTKTDNHIDCHGSLWQSENSSRHVLKIFLFGKQQRTPSSVFNIKYMSNDNYVQIERQDKINVLIIPVQKSTLLSNCIQFLILLIFFLIMLWFTNTPIFDKICCFFGFSFEYLKMSSS